MRKKAIAHSNYVGSVLPYGYGCVKKEEKVVFPDGTIYMLSSSWVADPRIVAMKSEAVQATPE